MRVIETVREMREYRREVTGSVALVATLGGIHAGHEAHLVRARELADVIIGSLFLNPTQFSVNEDLTTYPHDRDHDLAIFEKHGVSAVFAPSKSEMYPTGDDPDDQSTVNPGRIATILEGARRPGHFTGVATVVAKLFAIVRPDVSTFGQKDAQQLRIIEKLNRDLMFGVKIERIPTVREPDGLALSSRNQYLNTEQRAAAPSLFRSLESGHTLWKSGVRNAESIRSQVLDVLRREPLVQVDYVSVADSETLEEISEPIQNTALLSFAVRIGQARLIDNVVLD